MRVLTLIGLLLSVAISTAQSVKDLKPGTQAYRAVVDAAGKRLKKQMGFRVGNTLDVVRIWGDLAFVFDRLESTSGSQQDYEFACLLRRVKGKWRATSSTIGQGARRDLLQVERSQGAFQDPASQAEVHRISGTSPYVGRPPHQG